MSVFAVYISRLQRYKVEMINTLLCISTSQRMLVHAYYWPEPKPVALRATGQVSTLTELG